MQTPIPMVPAMDRSNAPQATGTIRPIATMAVTACDPAMIRKFVAVSNRLGTQIEKMRIRTAHTYSPLKRSMPRLAARLALNARLNGRLFVDGHPDSLLPIASGELRAGRLLGGSFTRRYVDRGRSWPRW